MSDPQNIYDNPKFFARTLARQFVNSRKNSGIGFTPPLSTISAYFSDGQHS